MNTERTWTQIGPAAFRKNHKYNDCAVPTGGDVDLAPDLDCEGAKAGTLVIRNRHGSLSVVAKVYYAGVETPTPAFATGEYQQKPDGATTYTVLAGTVQIIPLTMPVRYVRVRGVSSGAAFDNSVDVSVELTS